MKIITKEKYCPGYPPKWSAEIIHNDDFDLHISCTGNTEKEAVEHLLCKVEAMKNMCPRFVKYIENYLGMRHGARKRILIPKTEMSQSLEFHRPKYEKVDISNYE